MECLDELMDEAKIRLKTHSDRAFAAALGLNPTAVHQYRVGKAWPSDNVMMDIGIAAGISAERALLLLSVWRNPEPARTVYLQMLEQYPSHSETAS